MCNNQKHTDMLKRLYSNIP